MADTNEMLVDALYLALPFVEDWEITDENGYKPGVVAAALKTIRSALAAAEAQQGAAVAWMHTLHLEGDQNHSVPTLYEDHPFGVKGRDFDPSYEVTTRPLIYGDTAPPAQAAPEGWQPIETVNYWADAYSNPQGDEYFMGHGMVAKLLREYAQLRAMLAAAPKEPTCKS